MLAMVDQAPLARRQPASSLTSIASMLAPTEVGVHLSQVVGHPLHPSIFAS